LIVKVFNDHVGTQFSAGDMGGYKQNTVTCKERVLGTILKIIRIYALRKLGKIIRFLGSMNVTEKDHEMLQLKKF